MKRHMKCSKCLTADVILWKQVFISQCQRKEKMHHSVTTLVYFDDLPDSVICAYANSDGPLDKSGVYGYLSRAMSLIKKIDGDFANVICFPLNEVCKHIARMLQE